MDQDVKDRLDEQKEYIDTRASKGEVNLLRWLVGIILVAIFGAGGTGACINFSTSERISVVETRIGSFEARQQENNQILKDIEHLLRENH